MTPSATAIVPKKPLVGIIIGLCLMVLGPAAGAGLIVYSTMNSFSGVLDAPTHSADGSTSEVTLASGAEVGIWITEGSTGQCAVADPSGQDVLFDSSPSAKVTTAGLSLAATFTPAVDGSYMVWCTSDGSPFEFRVAPVVQVTRFAGGLLIGIGVIVVTGLVGLVILILGLVRRSRWNGRYGRTGAQYAPAVVSTSEPAGPSAQRVPALVGYTVDSGDSTLSAERPLPGWLAAPPSSEATAPEPVRVDSGPEAAAAGVPEVPVASTGVGVTDADGPDAPDETVVWPIEPGVAEVPAAGPSAGEPPVVARRVAEPGGDEMAEVWPGESGLDEPQLGEPAVEPPLAKTGDESAGGLPTGGFQVVEPRRIESRLAEPQLLETPGPLLPAPEFVSTSPRFAEILESSGAVGTVGTVDHAAASVPLVEPVAPVRAVSAPSEPPAPIVPPASTVPIVPIWAVTPIAPPPVPAPAVPAPAVPAPWHPTVPAAPEAAFQWYHEPSPGPSGSAPVPPPEPVVPTPAPARAVEPDRYGPAESPGSAEPFTWPAASPVPPAASAVPPASVSPSYAWGEPAAWSPPARAVDPVAPPVTPPVTPVVPAVPPAAWSPPARMAEPVVPPVVSAVPPAAWSPPARAVGPVVPERYGSAYPSAPVVPPVAPVAPAVPSVTPVAPVVAPAASFVPPAVAVPPAVPNPYVSAVSPKPPVVPVPLASSTPAAPAVVSVPLGEAKPAVPPSSGTSRLVWTTVPVPTPPVPTPPVPTPPVPTPPVPTPPVPTPPEPTPPEPTPPEPEPPAWPPAQPDPAVDAAADEYPSFVPFAPPPPPGYVPPNSVPPVWPPQS
ncbi:MAG: hypothetical protein LBI33_01995 [Propionibacteriaceae bacterium]|nr:hypothetical protein [Propionibacteriaceae bacterium]